MDVSKPNILMIIPNLGMGGAQRSFLKLANWLSEKYKVIVVVFDDQYPIPFSFASGICYLHTEANLPSTGIIRLLARFKRLKQLKKENDINISISFLEGADYLNLITGVGEKKLLSIRGSKRYDPHIKGWKGWIRRKILIPLLYVKAEKIITASLGLEYELKSDYPALANKLITIQNGYQINKQIATQNDTQFFVLGWAGRFSDEKGLLELLTIFMYSKKTNKNLKLVLLGKGQFKTRILDFIATHKLLGFDCAVFTLSDLENHDIVICDPGDHYEAYLRQINLFVLTSPSEGFPNGLVEAMQSGVVVISTDAKWGPREIIAPELGYDVQLTYPYYSKYGILMPLISKYDVDESINLWVTTISKLAKDKGFIPFLSKASIARAADFDQNKIKKQWFTLLENVLK